MIGQGVGRTFRAMVRLVGVLLWLGAASLPGAPVQAASAVAVAGQDDPAFRAALALWLEGAEDRALPELAAAAQAGNPAAQVLLGLIDTTPALQGLWLAEQPRRERLALLRAPGGLSGTNWMRHAARTEPLAALWLRLWSGDADVGVMLDFARRGELRAAHLAAKTLALRDQSGFPAAAEDPAFPEFARVLALREAAHRAPQGTAPPDLAALHPGDPARPLLGGADPGAEALDRFLAGQPAFQALPAALARMCPDPANRLADQAALVAALGGWWGLAEVGPPVAAFIAPDIWAASPVNRNALAQSLRPLDRKRGQSSGSACIDAVSETIQSNLRQAGAQRARQGAVP